MWAILCVGSLALDLRAEAVAAETTVTGKRREELRGTEYGGYVLYLSFGPPLDGEFSVGSRDFRSFEEGDKVVVRYFPHSTTIVSIRKA